MIEGNQGTAQVTFEQVIEVLGEEEATEFNQVMNYVQAIIDSPEKYNGLRAIHVANQLAALRTKIGLRAQHYKAFYSEDKSMTTKRRKYLTETLYHALEENINTLKLIGRVDAKLS